jgi:hypothetical protein
LSLNNTLSLGEPWRSGWWWTVHSSMLHFMHFVLLKQSFVQCPLVRQRRWQLNSLIIFILYPRDKDVNFEHDESWWSALHRRHVKVLLPSWCLAAVESEAACLLPMILIEGGCSGFRSDCCRPDFWFLLPEGRLWLGDGAGDIKQC